MRSIIKLRPDEREESCSCCVYSEALPGLVELSCSKKGIVAPEYVCKKFTLDIMAKTARRKHTLDTDKIQQMDFSID